MKNANRPSKLTQAVFLLIAIVQIILGVVFVVTPHAFPNMFGLAPAPGWTDWIFAQFGARALGFGYGMWLVLRDPHRNAGWIRAMIGVQIIDWIGTVLALMAGNVTLSQVTTAPFLPILFVAVLAFELRRQASQAAGQISGGA